MTGFALLAAVIAFATGASAQASGLTNEEATALFRDAAWAKTVAAKSAWAGQCQAELTSDAWGKACDNYRGAILEMFDRDNARLQWCLARMKRLQADAGGGPKAKILVPPVCELTAPWSEQDERISDLMAKANPTGAAMAERVISEIQTSR